MVLGLSRVKFVARNDFAATFAFNRAKIIKFPRKRKKVEHFLSEMLHFSIFSAISAYFRTTFLPFLI